MELPFGVGIAVGPAIVLGPASIRTLLFGLVDCSLFCSRIVHHFVSQHLALTSLNVLHNAAMLFLAPKTKANYVPWNAHQMPADLLARAKAKTKLQIVWKTLIAYFLGGGVVGGMETAEGICAALAGMLFQTHKLHTMAMANEFLRFPADSS